MAFEVLTQLDLNNNELLNALLQNLSSDPGSPPEALIYYNTTSDVVKYYNGAAWITLGRLNEITAPNGSLDLNSQKIVNLANGTASGDAVNKGQLDGAVAGVNWKGSVRAATTANGTLATAYENGDTIDGVTLATGDRILLKNQTSGDENGVYTVNASGAPTRATDMDADAEILQAAVFVREGTTLADSGWVNTTNGPITIGTTATVWAQFTGGSAPVGGAGLTLTGSTLDVIAGATPGSGGPGGGLVVSADEINIDKDVVVRKYNTDIGDNSSTSITVTHNLGTVDVQVSVWDKTTPYAEQHPEVRHTTTNTITLVFSVAPTTNQFRCSVQG